ncbi:MULTISPECIES: hypothetical protein [Arthrobacter]|uniref:Tight adherence protein B n=1 Tax=Arthrobacter oryzae TaxID=409290 RepID=A0A3N0C485_9MICC|nr:MULTISPECIES: hypothetical protein [Arthrobacter]QYF89278.1 hypothetical protein KY499_14290 [Arthrobacter sp. PAMC25284]RNL57441.1 hypothetical protein D7003_06690 [Arthrobacter oryzae]
MAAVVICVLALAAWLFVWTAGASNRRLCRALADQDRRSYPNPGSRPVGRGGLTAIRRDRSRREVIPMSVLVQQLAALLKGGRAPARLWDELWVLYADGAGQVPPPAGAKPSSGLLGADSLAFLTAARAAALRGSSVAEAIRTCVPAGTGMTGQAGRADPSRRNGRAWGELAACFDVAEVSGCPLADVLTRFAAQLEAENDAEAARQTALAGPKATVRLLTWLPVIGLGLGTLLGVDPVKSMLGTPPGVAALAAGLALATAGRIWSSRLVRAAAAAPP